VTINLISQCFHCY